MCNKQSLRPHKQADLDAQVQGLLSKHIQDLVDADVLLAKGKDLKGELRYAKVNAPLKGKPLEEKGVAAAMRALP